MECPMCYDLYDPEVKIPRNLNCGHTVCEECLQIVYEKKKFLDCPTCRYKHDPQIKPNMLTKNFIALQLACHKK
jgi:kelch-like protein 10